MMTSTPGRQRLNLSDTETTASSPSILGMEVSLTLHPYPGNIAKIRRLIDMYNDQIQSLTTNLPNFHDGVTQLYAAAAYDMVPEGESKQQMKAAIISKQRIGKRILAEISRLQDKRERLVDMLRFTNKHYEMFRAKMKSFKHRTLFV